MEATAGDVTRLLQAWNAGDRDALERLASAIYPELHRLAHRHMAKEPSGGVLQTTALIHEAYLRLADQRAVEWQNRAHFFAVASRVMRRVLVDAARKRQSKKRGADVRPVTLESGAAAFGPATEEILAVHEALERLAAIDERKSAIVEMRFFGGLEVEETAEVMGLSPATVKREWSAAKAWLYRALHGRGEA